MSERTRVGWFSCSNFLQTKPMVRAMGLVVRNRRAYLLESYRLRGRVTSRCVATGELALILAETWR